MLIGFAGAAFVLGLKWFLHRLLLGDHPGRRVAQCVFFIVISATLIAGVIFIKNATVLRITLSAMASLFLYAGLGVAFRWPGFRDGSTHGGAGDFWWL